MVSTPQQWLSPQQVARPSCRQFEVTSYNSGRCLCKQCAQQVVAPDATGHDIAPAAEGYVREVVASCTTGAWLHIRHAVPAGVMQSGRVGGQH